MTAMRDKLILTDCDGVLLDWEFGFSDWMRRKGYVQTGHHLGKYDISERYELLTKASSKALVREFNNSAEMLSLSPLHSSIKYIKKLNEEHGFVFHMISSQTDNKAAQKLRIMNLENVFGKHVFTQHTILGCGDDKNEALEPYRDTGCYWLEDKPANAQVGHEIGLRSILVSHHYNKVHDFIGSSIPRLNWKEIYELISENQYSD
jgi:beta-phosphoglucomutase-like phosphatase (HAD superfamily)